MVHPSCEAYGARVIPKEKYETLDYRTLNQVQYITSTPANYIRLVWPALWVPNTLRSWTDDWDTIKYVLLRAMNPRQPTWRDMGLPNLELRRPRCWGSPNPTRANKTESALLDFITRLLKVGEHEAILVIITRFSKHATFVPTPKQC